MALILDGCYPWQVGGCEWSIPYLWRSMSRFGRLDVIVLALMLAYVVAVVTHVSWRYHLARRARGIDTASRRKLVADLSIEVGGLKSIASTAPYLGLVGTCVGILGALGPVAMQRHAFLAMMATKIGAALVTTAAGILVAIPTTCSYNYLCTRIDLVESEVSDEAIAQISRYRQVARRFSLTKRFSVLPAFALIAAPGLAILVAAFMTFSSFRPPRGFPVRLVQIGVLEAEHFSVEPIVIEIIGTSGSGPPAVYVNSKKMPSDELENRLRSELKVRPRWLAYVRAENNVSWRDVVNVIDVVEGLHANVVLLTIAPNIKVARKSD